MRIGQVADAMGLPTRTIRFYERRGLLPEPRRAPNGYRAYEPSTLDRIRFIRTAQAAGLTLAETGKVIDIRDTGAAPCEHVDQLLEAKLADVRDRRRVLDELEAELDQLLERSRTLDPADCDPGGICQILQTGIDGVK